MATSALSVTVFEIQQHITINFPLKIAAKPLQIEMVTFHSLQKVLFVLSNGTIANPIQLTIYPQYIS